MYYLRLQIIKTTTNNHSPTLVLINSKKKTKIIQVLVNLRKREMGDDEIQLNLYGWVFSFFANDMVFKRWLSISYDELYCY